MLGVSSLVRVPLPLPALGDIAADNPIRPREDLILEVRRLVAALVDSRDMTIQPENIHFAIGPSGGIAAVAIPIEVEPIAARLHALECIGRKPAHHPPLTDFSDEDLFRCVLGAIDLGLRMA